ncbi:YbaB/EbfC family nucleoid-associated protein [Micromonospora sp. NPDC050397]|uniref:YbaB/EbfC family nucleoid-associated protein n=1 Tax=Micromonospora sp. NPDC050397 TaxID=3364279 RepID=UPI00384BD418
MDSHAMTERARRVQEAIAEASVELTSDDHAVTVVVGPGGAVRDLHLSSRAFQYDGARLGEIVVDTIRLAHARMGEELSVAMAEVMGDRTGGPFRPLPTPAQLRTQLDREGGGAR